MSCNKVNNCEKYKINIGNPNYWENPCDSCHYNISDYDIGYSKAIDDFVERMSLEISESIIGGMLFDNRDNSSYDTADKIVDYVVDTAKKIAEEMKKGGGNIDN